MNVPRIQLALLSLALCLGAIPLHTQSVSIPTEVNSLVRVRVVQQDAKPRRITGQLAFADSQRVMIEQTEGLLVVPVSQIRRLDVSLGHPKIGVARGASHGLLASVIVLEGLYLLGDGECEDCWVTPRDVAVAVAVPFTVVMMGVGALSGLLPGWEQWKRVSLPVRIRHASEASARRPSPDSGGRPHNLLP